MHTPDEPGDDLTPEEIEYMDRLIRAADPDDDLTAPEIDDRTMATYLRGDASPGETRTMQDALAGSRLLGNEILYIDGLNDPGVQARFDTAAAPPLRRRPPLWKPVLVWGGLAAAAAVVLLISTGRFSSRATAWSPQAPLVAGQFERDALRGGGEGLPEPSSAADAALQAFLKAVEWDGGDFRITGASETGSAAGRRVTVHVKGAADYTTRLPEGATQTAVWLLAVPSLTPYTTAVAGDWTTLSWPSTADRRAAVTITYLSEGRHSATPAGEVGRP